MKRLLVMAVAIMFSTVTVATAQTTQKQKTYPKKEMSKDSMKTMKDTSTTKKYKPMKKKTSKPMKDSMM